MIQTAMANVKAMRADEICKNFALKEDARSLLREGQSPSEFLELLLGNERYPAAVEFLAHAMPPREAIWWGCLCLQHAAGSSLALLESEALKAAAEWVLDPSEDNRGAARARGEAVGVGAPAGSLAMAVAWTGGGLAPPSQPHPKVPPPPLVPPGPFLSAKAVKGAVLLAAVKADPLRISDTQRLFVELGIAVAEGRFPWPAVKRVTRERTWKRRISSV